MNEPGGSNAPEGAAARPSLRVLELYCGIGGVAAALGRAAEIVAAIDINRDALEVYGLNFGHGRLAALLESLDARRLGAFDADLWWASPPCQPFTRRGHRRDLEDPRAATFRALVERIDAVRPRYLALENVAAFETSAARDLLLAALDDAGYAAVEEHMLCPSDLGQPNRRPRYYLLASRAGSLNSHGSLNSDGSPKSAAPEIAAAPDVRRLSGGKRPGAHRHPYRHWTLRQKLGRQTPSGMDETEPSWAETDLLLDAETARRYRHAIHVVDAQDPGAVTTCFTAAYGRSPVRSGSYLATPRGPRRFSPAEVLTLLGFPAGFQLGTIGARKAWRLAGNSLSIPAVRHVLSRVPELSTALGSDRSASAPPDQKVLISSN